YFIAADVVTWDYVPGGRNEITGEPFADSIYSAKAAPKPVSTAYKKILYREYTDATFSTLKARAAKWDHLGFLGPMIHAEVGDTIKILFRNNSPVPATMHPHGVFYNKDSEGSPYVDGTKSADLLDDGVPTGKTHEFVWAVPERAGPASMDGSSVMWMYHSHADETRDVNSGLLGVMIVTARGMARPDGSPKDVDRELVATFAQVHEEDSWLVKDNIDPALLAPPPNGPIANPSERQNFYPYFVKFTINGFIHGTLPLESITVKKGSRVRWYVMGSTNDFDAHAPHWHGNVVTVAHMRTDVGIISPMSMLIADMVPDNAGTWLFHCHITFHNAAGMTARYRVE
ncbi:MAG: multicopper oxidase domain-containing protein, partial [Gemmatimonadaceae bacterium]|nr:multicopper oxidase domain-containing protein [Gemmatimonadaceae bacterium]